MANKYNWAAWDNDVPGAIRDNFDDYRVDDVCPDVNNTNTGPTKDYLAEDLVARDTFRFHYYLPGSAEDLVRPRDVPRIESTNIVHTTQLTVFLRGSRAHG